MDRKLAAFVRSMESGKDFRGKTVCVSLCFSSHRHWCNTIYVNIYIYIYIYMYIYIYIYMYINRLSNTMRPTQVFFKRVE